LEQTRQLPGIQGTPEVVIVAPSFHPAEFDIELLAHRGLQINAHQLIGPGLR
jgi:hypothetical protein